MMNDRLSHVRKKWAVCIAQMMIIGSVASASLVSADVKSQPNIVLMFADDLGYGDLACYGHPYAVTPVLDKLAEEGTRFEQFYVTGVTCNPSRTGLMTGRFPARFERYTADFGFGNRVAVTELLKERGYATGHFGKWHIGPIETDGTYGIDTIEVIGKSKSKSVGRDDDLYGAAIKFIKTHENRPFYLNIWGHATHYPVDTAEELVKEFAGVNVEREDFAASMQHKFEECEAIGGELNDSMRQYLGDVRQIDRNVGRVLAALEECGLAENTIVVFSSDHGPAPVILGKKGAREFSSHMLGYAGAFRGGKHSQYEGGTRVPFIVRWPGHVQAGRVDSTSVCSFIDWLPTLCSIAGISDVPRDLDGEDLSDIWLGKARDRKVPLFWKTSAAGSTPAIRLGKWKLHLPRRKRGVPELYDLSVDPSESHNIASEFSQVVASLTRRVREWESGLPETYQKGNSAQD